jgi:cytochrome c556
MLITMRKATIFISALALGAFGLFAQDDLTQYQTLMKTAAGANGAIRGAINAGDTATVAAKAKDMSAAFDQMATFWKAKGKDDAVKLSETARDAAKAAAAATTIDDQKAAMAKVGPTCMGCHATYRDGNKFKGL